MSLLPVVYGDAATRGALRAWKTRLAVERGWIGNLIDNRSGAQLMRDFVRKGSVKGRSRALKQLDVHLGAGATLYNYALDGPRPFALWRVLTPRPSRFPEAAPDSGLAQDVVEVDYITLAENGFFQGMWALMVPDHALGRALQRSRLDSAGIILAAHTNLLKLRVEAVLPNDVLNDRRKFWVRAGPGAFCCRMGLRAGHFAGRAEERVWVFAHTWYGNEMLQSHHVVLTPDGEPGEQLGDSWLRPLPLRRPLFKAPPQRKNGLPEAFDASRPPPEAEFRLVIEELAGADLVVAEYDSGEWRPIKGEELWACIQAGEDSTADGHVTVARVRVVNTMVLALAEDRLSDKALAWLRAMLLIAGAIPDGQHDHQMFDAALARAEADYAAASHKLPPPDHHRLERREGPPR
jgi:hypothetical protein